MPVDVFDLARVSHKASLSVDFSVALLINERVVDGETFLASLDVRRFTRRADRHLPPGCYGNLLTNVKRGQSRPKRTSGVGPKDMIGPRSRYFIIIIIHIYFERMAR